MAWKPLPGRFRTDVLPGLPLPEAATVSSLIRPIGRSAVRRVALLAAAVCACTGPPPGRAARAVAQQPSDGQSGRSPIIEFPNLGPVPGSDEPALGPTPGAFEAGMGASPSGVFGGRGRRGRVPAPGTRGIRPGVMGVAGRAGMSLPEQLPGPGGPNGPVAARGAAGAGVTDAKLLDATLLDDGGPADGITLDEAIDRMMAANLDIRALRHELPQADADIITAGLRTNPLLYMDTQFIPYGSFNDARPGGPTQYDVNITYPIDVSRKRQARVVVARMARSALEAQFQDVVRRQIDNLYRAFVSLQAARIALVSADAGLRQHEAMLARSRRTLPPAAAETAETLHRQAYAVEQATLARIDAEEAFADAQESLAVILNEPVETTTRLQARGTLRGPAPPPPLDELTRIALESRPDLRSQRLGVSRANAEVALQRANRFDDVYLFYDPFTYQDNRPVNRASSRSWAVGLTFALPIYNRNQGNIARATSNVQQTRNELSSLERRVVSEVRLAEREYQASRRALEQIERTMLPLAQESLRRHAREFAAGDLDIDDYQSRLDEAAEIANTHRDALVRHRRAMLDLNTAVGMRIMP